MGVTVTLVANTVTPLAAAVYLMGVTVTQMTASEKHLYFGDIGCKGKECENISPPILNAELNRGSDKMENLMRYFQYRSMKLYIVASN